MVVAQGLKSALLKVITACSVCLTRARSFARRASYTIQRSLNTSANAFSEVVSTDIYSIPKRHHVRDLKYILVFVDRFSRFYLLATLRGKTAEEIDGVLLKWLDVFPTMEVHS